MNKPDDLGTDGSALWDDTVAWAEEMDADIRPDEYRILATACRVYDNMAELVAVFNAKGREWTVAGSTKQPVTNPLMTEWRFLSERYASLMKQLGLPDTEKRSVQRVDDMSARMTALARMSHSPGSKRYA